jgi:hypothetical protein
MIDLMPICDLSKERPRILGEGMEGEAIESKETELRCHQYNFSIDHIVSRVTLVKRPNHSVAESIVRVSLTGSKQKNKSTTHK